MFLLLAKFSLGFSLYGAAPSTSPPDFECADAERVSYKIWIDKSSKKIRFVDHGKIREIGLSGANLLRPVRPGQPLRYNGWNPKGRTIFSQLDGSVEFSKEYLVENQSSRIRVSLVIDDKERTGLVCQVSGISASVVSLDKELSLSRRYSALIEEVVPLRTPKGLLKPIAVQRMEGFVRRMSLEPELKKVPERVKFAEGIASVVKDIDPRSATLLSARLRGPIGEFWKQLLEDMKFKYHPDYSRCASWVNQGARPGIDRDIASVIAGFNQFASSPGFKDKDIRELFIGEVTESMKALSEQDVHDAKTELSREAAAFFEPLWVKVNGRKTLTDYPEVQSVASRLIQAVRAKEFEPLRVHKALTVAYQVLKPLEAEPRAIFKQTVGPTLRSMTERQKEDLLGWLQEPTDKAFYLELVR